MARVQSVEKSDSGFKRSRDVFGTHCFVGMMTDAAGTAQKQHRGGHATRDDHSVMARAAGHFMLRTEETCKVSVHRDRGLVEAWLPSNRESTVRGDLAGAVNEF
jgi:hypothetical protein